MKLADNNKPFVIHFLLDHRIGGPHIYVKSIITETASEVNYLIVTSGHGPMTDISLLDLKHFWKWLYPLEIILNVILIIWTLLRSRINKDNVIFDVHGAANIAPLLVAKMFQIPVVWHLHETISTYRFFVSFGQRILKKSLRFVVVAKKIASIFNIETCEIIYPSVDIEFWKNNKSQPEIKNDHGTEIRIASVGNLNRLKGHDLLVDALMELKVDKRIDIYIVGAALTSQKDYLKQLKKKISKVHNFKPNIKIHLSGWHNQNGVRNILERCDFFVLPSRSEASPISLLEAMAMGKFCIATDVGDISEIINDPSMGLIISPNDVMALAEALKITCEMSMEKHGVIGKKAIHRIKNNFSSKPFAMRHLQLYQSFYHKQSTIYLNHLEPNIDFVSLTKQFTLAITKLSIDKEFNKANAIFIKPNLTYPVYKKGVTTRIEFIECLIKALRKINDRTVIYIGEGEGGYNSFSMNDAFKTMGFLELEKKYPHVKIINLSEMPTRDVEINTPKGTYNLNLPEIFFNEIDFSISCPVPKVHCMTGVSLSLKNLWGCLPDVMRLRNHYIFDHAISEISSILKFKYAFLDGKYGLNNNGPLTGDAVEINWFAASNSLGAFDMVVSEMMSFDWKDISHLEMAGKCGLIPKRESVDIIGDIELFKLRFVLKRDFWNYPALAAFHSKQLTHLVYLSRWAKPIHDTMYKFRKRPIDNEYF